MLLKAAKELLRLYQNLGSPLIHAVIGFFGGQAGCRFEPSCSHYSHQALERHGFLIGSFYSVYRIVRCNPFCKPGMDPVP